jgi:abequosyltransferase
MKPSLSICIPNYNRAEYLYKNIEAIAVQLDEDDPVEVVVTDDKSKEDIDTVITKAKQQYPELNLRYFKNKTNLGFDLNVINVVEKSSGKFCWLLSNDDVVKPGAIGNILNEIEKNKDVKLYLVNYERFDKLSNSVTASRMINMVKDVVFLDHNEFWFRKVEGSYFKALGVNTLTMSCNIFERKSWMKFIPTARKFVGHNFIHVFCVAMIAATGKTKFIGKPQVRYLANNHRTWPNDIWKDYNSVLMNYLISLGYDEKAVDHLRIQQREYEKREGLTKNAIIASTYKLLAPLYYRLFKTNGR